MKSSKHFFLACMALLCLSASPVLAGSLDSLSHMLDNLSDMTRSADRAHQDLLDAMQGGHHDYGRYEHDWHQRESQLERERIRVMAKMAGVSESRIRSMREDGLSWGNIASRYGIEQNRFYGNSPYDHDRDKWRGTPPGLAKKGGMPPGQAKKNKHHNK